MVMSLFADEFAEKRVKKYIREGFWLDCNLSDYYSYLEYYDDGGYGTIHKVMDRSSGEYLILKRSSKKDFVKGTLESYDTTKQKDKNVSTLTLSSSSKINHFEGKLRLEVVIDQTKSKVLIVDPSLKASREAEFMVKVYNKLGGVALRDYYDDDDHYILIMEDGGRSLESISCSHRKKIIDLVRYEAYQSNFFYRTYLKQIIGYMIKIYHKIKNIHDLGIHHNDLKPENILVNDDKITIIDYGVSKPVEESYESYKGTLEYIPYEFVETGSYKPWDHTIWCFGVMLHFLTLMKYPFLKEEDVLDYNLNYKKIDKLPQSFSNLIYDCLQKDPLNRPQNLLERLEKLETY